MFQKSVACLNVDTAEVPLYVFCDSRQQEREEGRKVFKCQATYMHTLYFAAK
jgi:hypothetical protein